MSLPADTLVIALAFLLELKNKIFPSRKNTVPKIDLEKSKMTRVVLTNAPVRVVRSECKYQCGEFSPLEMTPKEMRLNQELLDAADMDDMKRVDIVLGQGANVNCHGANNTYRQIHPIHLAVRNGNLEMVKRFVRAGAHLNVLMVMNDSALSGSNGRIDEYETTDYIPIELARKHGHESVETLLKNEIARVCVYANQYGGDSR